MCRYTDNSHYKHAACMCRHDFHRLQMCTISRGGGMNQWILTLSFSVIEMIERFEHGLNSVSASNPEEISKRRIKK